MQGENLTGLGSIDPDDLAVVLCAVLRYAGAEPRITVQLDEGMVRALEVRIGDRLLASLPMAPLPLTSVEPRITAAIECAGVVLARGFALLFP